MPPAITLVNNGATISISESGGDTRLITKAQVRELTLIQQYFIRLDLGLGPLYHIYVDYRQVTEPQAASAEELRDLVNSWLPAAGEGSGEVDVSGLSTHAKQDEQIIILQGVITRLDTIRDQTTSLPTRPGQDSQSSMLSIIQSHLYQINNRVNGLATSSQLSSVLLLLSEIESNTALRDPLAIDETNPMLIYKGYAQPGALYNEMVWAVERVEMIGGIVLHTWADGRRDFAHSWDGRQALNYS